MTEKVFIATRGSALALAQSNMIMAQCRQVAPELSFELKIIKTTGDKLQTASMAQEGAALPKGLFTKELEVALLNGEAHLAVHSLKDLPTELPQGLCLGAVTKREDVRDVLLYRDAGYSRTGSTTAGASAFRPGLQVRDLPAGSVVATSSTRRKAQLLVRNAGLKTPDIRGNVATRMRKLTENPELDATILAWAGMKRLHFSITAEGRIEGQDVPPGLLASLLDLETMLPCVGQGAIGIEISENNLRMQELCRKLTHYETMQCVLAERAFLAGMGGGCQSPVAAYAEVHAGKLKMRALSFANGPVREFSAEGDVNAPAEIGRKIAEKLRH